MKVGILGPFPPFRGGIATFNAHLFLHLASCSQPVALNYCQQYPRIIFPGRTQLDQSQQPFPVSAHPFFTPFRPWRWPAARRQLGQEQLALLVLSWWTPIFAPSMYLFLKKFRKSHHVPLLAVCHNVLPHEKIPLSLFFQKRLLGLMDTFITHNVPDGRIIKEWFPERTVKSLFHPVYDHFPSSPDLKRPGAREILGIPRTGRPVILFFGLVRPYKGLSTLLGAMQKLVDTSDHVPLLIIAGEFYEKNDVYEPLLSRLVNAGHVLLHDYFIPNEDVHRYFTAADAVILPYHHATQSGVIPLAYASGRGVVTTHVGGLAEMVEDGVSGILVPSQDPAALAAGIQRYLIHQSAIESNMPHFARQYGWDHYIQQVLDGIQPSPNPPFRKLNG